MFFWIKKSKIFIDCFTYSYYAYEYAKFDHAVKYTPEWWKNTPKISTNQPSGFPFPTIKNCKGFIDFYKTGLILPSWFEMELTILKKGDPERFRWIASNEDVDTSGSHSIQQFLGFAEEDGVNMKIGSPWFLRTKEKVNFIWSQPTWNFKKFLQNTSTLPAVINFYEQHETHVNLFIQNDDNEKKIIIEPRTPLAILHPMSDKSIKLNHHLVSIEEAERVNRGIFKMFLTHTPEAVVSKSKRKDNFLRKLEESNSNCPFK